MKGYAKRLMLIGLVVVLGVLAWRFAVQRPLRMAGLPPAGADYRAPANGVAATAAGSGQAQKLGENLAPDVDGRFQTEIDPRFQAYSSTRILDALIAADASSDRETVLVALATLERRAQLGDAGVPRLLLDSLDKFPAEKQKALIALLGRIATPAALEALFEQARPQANLRKEALAEIGKLGTHVYDNGEYPVELSPPLEQRLPQTLEDPGLLAAVAGGLASIGTASGIDALLKLMESRPDTPQSDIVAQQLQAVRNPEAVAPLATRLNGEAGALSTPGRAAGNALAAMGQPAATGALLEWAAQAEGGSAREQALRWFGEVRDDESFEEVLEADARYEFRDPGLLEAIQALVRTKDEETQPYVEGPEGE